MRGLRNEGGRDAQGGGAGEPLRSCGSDRRAGAPTCASNCVTAGTGLNRLLTTKPARRGQAHQQRVHGAPGMNAAQHDRLLCC